MVNFYTEAPTSDYPWILTTKIKKALALARTTSVILDSGIYKYLVKLGDYPEERVLAQLAAAEIGLRDGLDIHVAGCDMPPLGPEFGMTSKIDNVKYTLEMWDRFRPFAKTSIFTVQFSSFDTTKSLSELALYPTWDVPWVGVGGLCRLNYKKQTAHVRAMCEATRARYPRAHIHVWGMSIVHLTSVAGVVDSFDSSKWTRPVHGRGLPSAMNTSMRKEYFGQYLDVIADKLKSVEPSVTKPAGTLEKWIKSDVPKPAKKRRGDNLKILELKAEIKDLEDTINYITYARNEGSESEVETERERRKRKVATFQEELAAAKEKLRALVT
ncbi:MAG: hypothetical protein M0R66_03830 [Candidatus Omnitrophica bacterium]|nr:hypothetical protein [Candidatus Omnitrophota bacterium]